MAHLRRSPFKETRNSSVLSFSSFVSHSKPLLTLKCSPSVSKRCPGPRFLVPSVVSDSIVERENCILFTQRLQYATFPLYSLQLTTRSTSTDTRIQKAIRNRARSGECKCSQTWLKALTLSLFCSIFFFLFPQHYCDTLPWHVIKKCHRFWGSDFCCSLPANGQQGQGARECEGMMSWSWTVCIKPAFGGHTTFSWGIMEEYSLYCLSTSPI